MLQICRRAVVKARRCIGDVGEVPLTALDVALSAMDEEELRMLEYKTEQRSKIDLIADTWPLWYSIYVRKYGYKAAKSETNAPRKPHLNEKTLLMYTELNKHRPRQGKAFQVPIGDWRQAVDYKVTDAQVKLVRSKEVLKKAQKVAAAAEAAAKVKAATPKTALLPPKALAAQWRRQQALKKTGATLKAKSQMLKKKR